MGFDRLQLPTADDENWFLIDERDRVCCEFRRISRWGDIHKSSSLTRCRWEFENMIFVEMLNSFPSGAEIVAEIFLSSLFSMLAQG